MTPLRQRMIEDRQLRKLRYHHATQLHHYVADFAEYFNRSPKDLDLEAVRQYQLYLAQERKLSPQSINTFVSAVQLVYLTTLEMPWDKHDFPRARLRRNCPSCWPPTRFIRGDAHLKTLLDRMGSNSLSDYLKTTRQSPVKGKGREDRVYEEASTMGYASDQRFREAHRKTSTLHAGLFRRLAE